MMSLTLEQISLTNGNHLNDEELAELTKVVEYQRKVRSVLATTEPVKLVKKPGYAETQQDKFIRLADRRGGQASHYIKLLRNLGQSQGYLIDVEVADKLVQKLEKEIALLRTTYEKCIPMLTRKVKSKKLIKFQDQGQDVYAPRKHCRLETVREEGVVSHKLMVDIEETARKRSGWDRSQRRYKYVSGTLRTLAKEITPEVAKTFS